MQKIILVSGLPGSGKSTIAESVGKQLHIPVFSVDPIESSIIKSGITKSFETGLAAYLVVETLTSEQLKLGLSVIIDAVSPVKEARDMWQNVAKQHNANLVIIECVLDTIIHKQRLEKRMRNMHGLSEVTWTDVEKTKEEYLPWTEERLTIDTANTHEKNLALVVEYIQSQK